MARGRELSQLGSLINVEDSTKNIGVVHAAPSQKVGIGTISPTSKVDVRGDVVVSGIVTAAGFVGTGTDGSVSFVNKHETLTNKTLTAPIFQSGSNSPQFLEQRFVNANTIRFSQVYGGGANGSYFTQGEYQKICTIIPDGNSQNYTFIARITSTSASSYQIVYFSGALRSNTLPDLSFTTNYYQEHNGTAFIEPKLFTKETSTAGFIIAFEYIHNQNLYGNITCDVDIIPRSAGQRDNITINTTENSEQTSVDTGYTERDATLIYTNRSGVLEFGTQFRFEGATADGFETTVTATDPTADRTITFPDSSGTVALVGGNVISNVVEDTTPQLGGTLDVNSNDITGTGNVNLTGVVTATSFVGDGSGLTGVASTDNIQTATPAKFVDNVDITGIVTVSTLGSTNETVIVGTGKTLTSSNVLALDTSNNYLGINQTNPEVTLHMTGEGAQTAQIRMEQYNDTTDAPDVRTRRYRGTEASPSDLNTGDYVFRLNVEGQQGGSLATYGSVQFDVDDSDADATAFQLQTRDAGGTTDTRISIDAAGDTTVGTGLTIDASGGVTASGVITATSFVGDVTGNADTATTLETSRNIGGVSFNGSADINLPGVDTAGNQDTSGNAGTATSLATARTIAGVSFDGTSDISLNNNAITNGAGYITTSFTNTNQLTNGAGFITASDSITGTAGGLSGTPNITVGSVTASSGSFSGNVTVGGTLTYQDVTNMDVLGIGTFQQGIEVLANGLDVTGFSTFKTGVSVTGVVTATSFSGSGSGLTGVGVSALSDGDSSISIASTDGSLVFTSNNVIVATMSSETAFFNVPINLNSNKITNLAAPSSTSDGANKDYVDNQVAGDYPTGDYGDLSAGDTDAFGQVISDLTSFDCLTTPSGSLATTDLGELT